MKKTTEKTPRRKNSRSLPRDPARQISTALRRQANRRDARILQRFFKTGPGEYGAGDIFLGIKVPVIRGIAREYPNASLGTCIKLLKSAFHEERLAALILMTHIFKKGSHAVKSAVFNAYLANTGHINNWDLVDLSAPHIAGAFLLRRKPGILCRLAHSKNMWERRIAIVSTLEFIRNNRLDDTFDIAQELLSDDEDLIHKASGWMLREAGKRNRPMLTAFLDKYTARMPRTMLRYAIEKLPDLQRQYYLSK